MPHRPAPLSASPNLRLDAVKIVQTVEALHERIRVQFPDSGLGRLAGDVTQVARAAAERVDWVTRPILLLRAGVALTIAMLVTVVITLFAALFTPLLNGTSTFDAGELIQTLEAALNEIVFVGIAIFFLVSVEQRLKRRRALGFLRELRALAHIIDMHQLTKDPERIARSAETGAVGAAEYSPADLARYLDYCSDMLSLLSKIAALYIQNFDDPVVLAAVDEVETLTTGLTGKIWQKIMILERIM